MIDVAGPSSGSNDKSNTSESGDNTSREVQPRYVEGADTYVLHGGASICRVAGMFTGSPPNSPLSGTVNATGRSNCRPVHNVPIRAYGSQNTSRIDTSVEVTNELVVVPEPCVPTQYTSNRRYADSTRPYVANTDATSVPPSSATAAHSSGVSSTTVSVVSRNIHCSDSRGS